MTATTANYAFPYPELTDTPNGATEMQSLATAIDTQVKANADTAAAAATTNATNMHAVTSTAAVASPVLNQMVYDLSTSIVKRWNGSAWLDVMPGDTGTNHHEVEWTTTGAQSIPTNAATTVLWTAAPVTSPDMTVSAGTITAVRGGLWHFSFFVVTNVPTALSQVVCSRLLDHTGVAIMGSGSRSCTGDNGFHRAVAGDTFTVSHTQQTGTAGTAAGFFKASWIRG